MRHGASTSAAIQPNVLIETLFYTRQEIVAMNFLWSAAALLPLLRAQQNRPLAAQAQPAQAFTPSYEAIS